MHISAAENFVMGRAVFEMEQREARAEAIVERASEIQLPGGECDPFDASNLEEAITEASRADFAALASLLNAGDDLAAGARLRQITTKYWELQAPYYAEWQLENEGH